MYLHEVVRLCFDAVHERSDDWVEFAGDTMETYQCSRHTSADSGTQTRVFLLQTHCTAQHIATQSVTLSPLGTAQGHLLQGLLVGGGGQLASKLHCVTTVCMCMCAYVCMCVHVHDR